MENIQKTVADYFKIKVSDMYSKKRSRNIARPRQVAMALAKELTQMSLPEIGEAFGGRDHTTVLHACRTIASLRDARPGAQPRLPASLNRCSRAESGEQACAPKTCKLWIIRVIAALRRYCPQCVHSASTAFPVLARRQAPSGESFPVVPKAALLATTN